MHILLIHQAFVSPSEGGGTRHYELARYVVSKGHQFTVVASDVSYFTGKRITNDSCTGYKSEKDDIPILRCYTVPTLHRSYLWRVISFFSFMLTSTWTALRVGKVDIVIGTSPPIFQAFSTWMVALMKRCPFLLEIRDLWPAFAIDIGILKNRVLIALSRYLERFLYSRAKHIIVNSPAYRDYLLEMGLHEDKVSVVPNGVDVSMFNPDFTGDDVRKQYGLEGKFIVTYAGALGLANDIDTILHAAKRLQDCPEIHFVLAGDGKESARLKSLASQLELRNVTFTDNVPKKDIPDILAASDVCLATLKDIPMFRTTYPNKVFDYMAAGRPTLLAIDGVIRDVIESAHGGVFVKPGDPEELASKILELSSNPSLVEEMGRLARSYAEKHFDRQDQARKFLNVLYFVSHKN